MLCQEGLNPHNYSGFQIVRLGEVQNLQYSLLTIILTKKNMSFLLNSVLYFPHNYHMVKEKKWE